MERMDGERGYICLFVVVSLAQDTVVSSVRVHRAEQQSLCGLP